MRMQYDGGSFHGWQRQPTGVPTVQQSLEEALSRILNRPVKVRGAGRTDAGVHALAQWATFSAPTRLDSEPEAPVDSESEAPEMMESIRIESVGEARQTASGAVRIPILLCDEAGRSLAISLSVEIEAAKTEIGD